MNEIQQAGGSPMNVREGFALYDTMIIADGAKDKNGSWFNNYAGFSQRQRHSFFNVRNMGEVGIAYNNLETKDQMPFAFHLHSIGVSFAAPISPLFQDLDTEEGEIVATNGLKGALFVKEIPRHVGLRLRVRNDEKLIHTVELAPEGAGPYGNAAGQEGVIKTTNITTGMPSLDNRWRFPTPIGIPRGATYSVELELSEYAQMMLAAMREPGTYYFAPLDPNDPPVKVPAAASIRVSLIGKREVQQRGELHV